MRLALNLIAIAAAAVACGVKAAAGTTLDRAVDSRCTISGFLTSTGPKGTDVRSAPHAEAPVIGRLPPPAPLAPGDGDLFGAEFDIIGARNGWLLISQAEVETIDSNKVVFEGPGWIPGDKVGFIIGSRELLAAPSSKAKVVAKLSGEMQDGAGYGADSFTVLRVHACRGRFVELTIKPPSGARGAGAPMRGWVIHVCSNQKTTCDSGIVDPSESEQP